MENNIYNVVVYTNTVNKKTHTQIHTRARTHTRERTHARTHTRHICFTQNHVIPKPNSSFLNSYR